MTLDQAKKLYDLQNGGHMIKWNAGPYVDGFARITIIPDGVLRIESHVYALTPLADVKAREIEVYKSVDWEN